MEKGWKHKTKMATKKAAYTYVKRKDISALKATIDGVLLDINPKDILSGAYIAGKITPIQSKSQSEKIDAEKVREGILNFANDFLGKDYKADGSPYESFIKLDDIKKFIEYGCTEEMIRVFYAGWKSINFKIKADGEFLWGMAGGIYSFDTEGNYIEEWIKRAIENAKNQTFELGFKYPDFNWSKLLTRTTGTEVIFTPPYDYYGKKRIDALKIEKYKLGTKDTVVAVKSGGYSQNGEWSTSYDESERDSDVPLEINGGYLALVSRSGKALFDLAKKLLSQPNGYVKDLDWLLQSKTSGAEELIENNVKFAKGGGVKGYINTEFDSDDKTEKVVLYDDKGNVKGSFKTEKQAFDYAKKIGLNPESYSKSGKFILKDKQEDLKKSLQNSGFNIDFGGYEEFDGENVIYVHYPKKDEDKVANFLNNWLAKYSWKNATTAYESVDDFSGKKGYWTYVIEESSNSMAGGGGVGKKALYQSDKNKELTEKIIDTTHSFFESNGVKYGQVSDLGTEIVIEPSTVIPANSNLKKGSLYGMQIIYDIKSNVYEVSEYMAGPNENELFIFGEYKSLIPALKSLIKGNSSTGRKPIKKYAKGGGVKSSNNTYKLRAEGLNDFLAFLQEGMYFRVKSFTVETTSGPDVVVSFTTDASLSEIKLKLDEVPDSHVMLETVMPINEYTGERNEEYAKGGGVGASHYSLLGGSSPFTNSEMKSNVVEPNLGPNFETIMMFDENSNFNPRYKELQAKYPNEITKDWQLIYRSSNYQGYATISPNREVIKAGILDGGGIYGVFYVKSSAKHKMAKGGGVGTSSSNLQKRIENATIKIVYPPKKKFATALDKILDKYIPNRSILNFYEDDNDFEVIILDMKKVKMSTSLFSELKDWELKYLGHVFVIDKMAGGGGVGSSNKLKYSLYLDRTVGDDVTTYHIADFAAKGDLSIALESLKEAAPKNYMYYTK